MNASQLRKHRPIHPAAKMHDGLQNHPLREPQRARNDITSLNQSVAVRLTGANPLGEPQLPTEKNTTQNQSIVVGKLVGASLLNVRTLSIWRGEAMPPLRTPC